MEIDAVAFVCLPGARDRQMTTSKRTKPERTSGASWDRDNNAHRLQCNTKYRSGSFRVDPTSTSTQPEEILEEHFRISPHLTALPWFLPPPHEADAARGNADQGNISEPDEPSSGKLARAGGGSGVCARHR